MTEGEGEAVDTSTRFSQWAAYLVFSTITFGSALLEAQADKNDTTETNDAYRKIRSYYDKLCMIISGVIFGCNILIVIIHLVNPLANLFVGKKLEGFMSFSLMILWIVVVVIITDPKHGSAVDRQSGAVSNGNLYYFSWAGFVCGVTLFVNYLRAAFGVDVRGEIRSRAARLNLWAALLATSMVVTGSAGNFFSTSCTGQNGKMSNTCARTVFSITLGSLTIALCLLVIVMKMIMSKVSLGMESLFAAVLVICYIVGVGTTTTAQGPGAALGNLYYFTWLSFLLSFMISASCTEDRKAAKANDSLAANDHSSAISNTTLGADRNMWIA